MNSMMAVLHLASFLLVNVMVGAAQADSATGEDRQGTREVLRFQLFGVSFMHILMWRAGQSSLGTFVRF